jgi:3-oxoadipate enol-lactonase
MTLVLGSSLGTTRAMFDPLLGVLDEGVEVVRYDHRGHGGAPAPPGPYEIADLAGDVLALMDGQGIERASVGGVSLGGMVAMWLAANAPERVDRLVVICSSAYMPPASMWEERAAAVSQAGTTQVVADAVVDRWLTPPFADEHPDVRWWLRDMLVSADPSGYAACCAAISRMDLRPDLERITAPALVIGAADDPSAPPAEHSQVIAELIPGARLEIVPDAAHLAPVERPAEIARLVEEHLR